MQKELQAETARTEGGEGQSVDRIRLPLSFCEVKAKGGIS